MLADFKCTKCGNEEKDVMIKSFDEKVNCKICNTVMEKQFNGMRYSFKISSHTPVPNGVIGGGERARFGRI